MVIKTEDLIIRTVSNNDLDEVSRMWNFEKGYISLYEAKKVIEQMETNHRKNHLNYIYHLCFGIFEINSNKIIGWCGLDGTKPDKHNNYLIDIFYLVDKEYRNKGYATKCAKKLLELGFVEMQVDKIDGGCVKGNIASQKVLEKIGMKNKTLKDDGSPHYFLTKEEYLNF